MITIGGISLNGAEGGTSKFSIDPESGFDIGAPPPKWQWIDRRIGAIPVPNPSLPPMTIEIPLICVGTSANNILAEIGALRKVCDAVAGTVSQGGTEVSWQMIGATDASALICYAAEVGPVKIDRDDIHTRVGRFTLTLTCDPYILGPWATVKSGRKPAGLSAFEVQVASLNGDVPGPARITLTNQGSTAQQFAMLGLDCVDSSTASANKLVLLPSTFDYTTAPLNGTYTAGTNEVQTATKSGTISGGTFTLTYEGQTTSSLAYNASTATVQTALEALSTIGTGNITVGGTTLDAGNMTFTFTGTFANCDVSLIVLNSSLTGGGSAPITQTTQGVPGYVANTSLQSSFSDFMRTGDQTDTGSFQLWALVYTDADQNNARIRASISIGDTGSAVINRSATIPAKDAQVWVNLGPVHAKKRISSGSYRWNATIGAMTVGTAGTDVRVLRLAKLPVDLGVAVVKSPQPTTQTLIASDDFNQSAGGVTGKSADYGGTWSGAGDADDFTVDTATNTIKRTATGDTATSAANGRILTLASITAADVTVSARVF